METHDGPALFDCGPATCVDELKAGLGRRGIELQDVRHLLLSHIHLDHAGAAGVLVREHPALRVHVSAVGAPHLVDPSRLEASARRLYGDAFDELWGELAPVPEANVDIAGEQVLGLDCFPTPGHASHHVCYLDADGTLYAGDAAGVRIAPLVHFGAVDDVDRHVDELRRRLHEWVALEGVTETEFAETASADVGSGLGEYERAMPFWQSYAGLKRYWDKREIAAS